ncbi:MAG: class I SAM-dependent methyltransferase [Gammaproteobacteria bacterium]|nr:class I SAM-dependent methyltransferase [Gammaproteobacteria bacterium]
MNDPAAIPGAPIWRPEELEYLGQCPVCSSTERELRHADLEDRFFSTGTRNWRAWSCLRCASLYLDPRPRTDVIERAYSSYYTHEDPRVTYAADNGTSIAWHLSNGYLAARFGHRRAPAWPTGRWLIPLLPPIRFQLDYFARHLPKPSPSMTCLDVGCGNGGFLLRAQSAGWRACGVDVDENAVNRGRAADLEIECTALDDYAAAHREAYHAVTLSHVIEHVHDPVLFVSTLRKMLRPNGLLWIATPNVQSIGHRLFGPRWRGLEAPRHLVIFNRDGLSDLVRRNGFRDVRLRRRGRHSASILAASLGAVAKTPINDDRLPSWWQGVAWANDLLASIVPGTGEELVLTARRCIAGGR